MTGRTLLNPSSVPEDVRPESLALVGHMAFASVERRTRYRIYAFDRLLARVAAPLPPGVRDWYTRGPGGNVGPPFRTVSFAGRL